jgi:hypothetical protein
VDRIEALLEPGERLLWHGRPDTNRLVRRQYSWCFFAGAFFGLSLIWAYASWQRGTVIGLFVGLIFAAGGLFVVAAKAWDIVYARTTRYFVSNRRAAVVVGPRGRITESYAADHIGAVEVQSLGDGLSDVLFNREPRLRGYRGVSSEGTGFYGLSDPSRARVALETLALSAALH